MGIFLISPSFNKLTNKYILTYFDRAKLFSKIETNENLRKHYDLNVAEQVIKTLTESQIVLISDLILYKKYFKLNGILQGLGFKKK